MSDERAAARKGIVQSVREVAPLQMSWGQLSWLMSSTQSPGAEQTFGVVTIQPGQRNPLHRHPNCEELLYVLEGEAEHKLGDEVYTIKPGDVIRIPRGVEHWARTTSDGPLVAIISFSAGDRQTENLDETGDFA